MSEDRSIRTTATTETFKATYWSIAAQAWIAENETGEVGRFATEAEAMEAVGL